MMMMMMMIIIIIIERYTGGKSEEIMGNISSLHSPEVFNYQKNSQE